MVSPATCTTPWWSPIVMLPLARMKCSSLDPLRHEDAAHVDHEEDLEDDESGDGSDAERTVDEQQPDGDER